MSTSKSTTTAALLERVETCTLPDFTELVYDHVERVELCPDIPCGTGRLRLSDIRMAFVLGVNGESEHDRLLVFVHIVLYAPFAVHGHLPIDEGEIPFHLPHIGNGAAKRFLEAHYSAVRCLFSAKASALLAQ